jgi:peptide/nickel transport system substrate-binding protein
MLEANPSWWHKRPNLEGVELVFGVAEQDVIAALQRGDVDFATVNDADTWLDAAYTAEFLDKFETSEVVEARIRLIGWNTQRGPLRDARVRRGLTLALDRNRLIGDVLFNQAQPLATPMFPTMFGYDPSVAVVPFDLDEALKLLDEAHPRTGDKRFSLEVIVHESLRGPASDGMATIFQRDLATLGIDFKLTILPSKEYYERIGKRDYDGVYFGWIPDVPDPDPAGLLHSSQAKAGANFAAYSHPEIDRLVYEGRTTMDRDQRQKVYQQLARLLVEEMPYTPLFAPYGHYAWTERLRGVQPRDVGWTAPLPGIADWWIDKR